MSAARRPEVLRGSAGRLLDRRRPQLLRARVLVDDGRELMLEAVVPACRAKRG